MVESRTGEDKLVVSSPISVASGVKGLTFADEILYYLCSDDEICAHRVGDNSQLWKSSPITGTLSFDFSLRQNRLLYGENSSRFVGLDAENGATESFYLSCKALCNNRTSESLIVLAWKW